MLVQVERGVSTWKKNCTYIERDVRVSVDCTDEKLQEVVLKTFSEMKLINKKYQIMIFCKCFWMLSGLKGVQKEQYSIIGSLWNIYFQNESECKEDYHGRDSYLFIRLSENKQVFKCDD